MRRIQEDRSICSAIVRATAILDIL